MWLVYIAMMSILNGLIILSTVIWTVLWISQILTVNKRLKIASKFNQPQMVGHELVDNIDGILCNTLSSSLKMK